jgi:hypothetical protein
LVTFFFARKESYPPPGRRSPLNPQKNPPKTQEQKTENAAIKPQAKETATLYIAKQNQHQGPIKPLTCREVSSYLDFV